MGWWEQDENGHSFVVGSGLVWGDGPADIFDSAIADVEEKFQREHGRGPTSEELLAGLKFALRGRDQ